MKSKYLFVIAQALLVAGVVILFHDFHGSVTLTGSAPVAGSAFEISGATRGAWALGGIITLVLSIVTFVFAAIRAFVFERD